MRCDGLEGNRRCRPNLVLCHVHSVQMVPSHGGIDIGRDYTKILAYNAHLVAVGFKAHNGIKLLGGVVHVDAMPDLRAMGNPEEPVQAHYMIQTQQTYVPQLMPEVGNNIPVT